MKETKMLSTDVIQMNDLSIFQNDQFGVVRVIQQDGDPWFVAVDVCRALDINQPSRACERLDEDEKGVSSIHTLGGIQELLIVNEPGLYTLIFGSRKPEAKAFRRWIAHDVIPSIRKYGVYKLQWQQMRIQGIAIRRSLTYALLITGENERMHGKGYSTYTNLVYKTALGKDTRQLRKAYGCKHPRDVMPAEDLEKVAAVERLVVDLLMLGRIYPQIKALMEQMAIAPPLPAADAPID